MAASPTITPQIPGGADSCSMAFYGSDIVSNTTNYTGDWCSLTALTDTVFTVASCSTISINGVVPANWSTVAITAGRTLFGRWTSVTLASGSVYLVRATAY